MLSQNQTPPPDSPMSPAQPTAPLSLSVVVPSYNNLPALIRCLKSLVQTLGQAAQSGPVLAEILVQDDGSTTFDALGLIGPPASVARNARNLGFAANCNAGAARAKGDVLLFLNQDTVAQPGWYAPLMAAFGDPVVGIVGPKLVFPAGADGQESIQSCGGLFDGGRGPFHRYLGYAADDWRVNVPGPASWTTGAALAIRRELFTRVGGFDEGYERGYFEDVDLCLKVAQAGHQIWYAPEASFEHSVGSTGGVPGHVFRANSLRFHARWDAAIVPDTRAVMVNY